MMPRFRPENTLASKERTMTMSMRHHSTGAEEEDEDEWADKKAIVELYIIYDYLLLQN